ncbi:MAG TPA: chromosome partitioning protein ParB [Acidimicrobiaceae bacterium]|nr:chromosome partitioning protein ParB [Acidimicrobiaceae bacterium]HCB37537.1 chromosome partitioning protein ParB [Acidimicrobiaceae bacterium]
MNSTKRGLGRGLGALIPGADTTYRELLVDRIRANPRQPRQRFDPESLAALAASITAVGVLQPIVVRAGAAAEEFEIVAGERRWRAARQAGLTTIPAVVKTSDDQSSLVNAVVENVHREDLNPLEESAAYRQLIDDFGLTHEQVGERIGRSRSAITNALRLLELTPAAQRLLADGSLSAGHARALLGCHDAKQQEALAKRAAKGNWTTRAVEEAVRAANAAGPASGGGKRRRGASRRPAALVEVEVRLAELLSTQVHVEMGARTGEIRIRFADMADLHRISTALIETPSSRA